ncbi:MAG: RsmD family RNA methyltransferase [Acidobacteria bacterium]|nr:RsmD family RNA methyltransferase [Acidobacteriota bacterium]
MRVIGGEFRSRRLKTLPGLALRPTPDLLREALFSVLASNPSVTPVEGHTFLDAYAGCGAVGIEALSRGAARAIFLEKNGAAVRVIRQNLASLDLEARATVAHGAVVSLLPRHPADIVFLDPPYPLEREYAASMNLLGAAPPKLVLVQHSKHFHPEPAYGKLRRIRMLVHSDNVVSFYTPQT